jgi:hypothetical protein
MTTEPFMDEVADAIELDVTTPPPAADAETEERRRRRKRRRRRGRRGDSTASRPERADGVEPAEETDEESFVELDDAPEDSSRSEVETRQDRSESGEERPRRRRRRRRRGGRREESAAAAESRPPAPTEDDDAGDEDDTLAEVLGEVEGDDELKGDEPQLSHKKIPSWQEAIDVVVATNMAQRSKHPSNSGRGRGGHRRERDR